MDPNEGANATNHIDNLPAEILRDIFVLCSLHSSSSVSRRWNSLALAEPRLWSKICIRIEWEANDWENGRTRRAVEAEISGASLWLARSKNAPLDLSIFFWNTPGWIHDRVKEIVFPHLHRCRYLELELPQPKPSSLSLIDYPKIWFPLPGMPDLDDLSISVEFGSHYCRKAVDIGVLPLRRFKFKSNFSSVLLLNIRVTGELELEGCDRETTVNILEHCTAVKWVKMVDTERLRSPFSLPLSFPSLRRLDVVTAYQFPLQAAPNLRQLRYLDSRTPRVDEFVGLSRDAIQILTSLEVLCLPIHEFILLPKVGNGSLLCSERLKALRIRPCYVPGIVFQSLISPVSPSSSPSRFVAEQQSAQHIAFPGLKLLNICCSFSSKLWSKSVLGLLQARPSLTIVCNFGEDQLYSSRFKEFTNLMPNRFILSFSSEVFDRFVKDLDIE